MLPLPNDPPCCSVRFELLADAEPGLLPRTLTPFAKRDLIPDWVHVRREDAALLVEIEVEEMPSEMVHLVEGNLRQIVGVQRVVAVLQEERRLAA
jgi:acetolactate synthase small subunit